MLGVIFSIMCIIGAISLLNDEKTDATAKVLATIGGAIGISHILSVIIAWW